MGDAGAKDPRVAVDVGLMHVNDGDIRIQRGQQDHRLAGEGVFHQLSAGVGKPVGPAERADSNER